MFTKNKCNQADAHALLGGQKCSIGKMVGVALWGFGASFDDSFGKSDLDAKIKEGAFMGAIIADQIENNDTDPTFKETLMKVRQQTDLGRKGFNFTFEKSPCFHQELNKLNNSENWGFTPILDDGSILAYEAKDGTKKPFPAKLFVGLYKLPIMGVDEQGTMLSIDLLPKGLNYWQNNGVVLTNDEIDFSEVNPIAGVNIDAPILTSGATSTKVKVTNLCSSSVVTGLLDVDNWKLERNGVLETVSAVSYDPITSEYKFTHSALNANDKVRFVISKNGQSVYVMDSNYYSGSSMTKIVA